MYIVLRLSSKPPVDLTLIIFPDKTTNLARQFVNRNVIKILLVTSGHLIPQLGCQSSMLGRPLDNNCQLGGDRGKSR